MARSVKSSSQEEDELEEEEEVVEEIEENDEEYSTNAREYAGTPSSSSSPAKGGVQRARGRSSPIVVSSTSPIPPSSDPLAMSRSSSSHSPVYRPLKRKIMVSGVKHRATEQSDSDGYSDATPLPGGEPSKTARDNATRSHHQSLVLSQRNSIGAKRAGDPKSSRGGREAVVEIPFIPLDELRQYGVSSRLHYPTRLTRRQVIDYQEDTTTITASSSRSPSRTASPVRKVRPLAAAIAVKPNKSSWRIASSPTVDTFSGDSEDDDEDDDDEDSDDEIARRRSKRVRNDQSQRRGPSPTRTRSKDYTPHSRDRQRMANTKRARSSEWSEETPDDDTEGEDGLESSEMEYSDSESDYDGRKTKGKGKNKVAIREKGLVKRHRAFCEKCRREPASLILEKFEKAQKKGGKRKKVDEDAIPDDELAEKLEGWLECSSCCIASHWDCLGPDQCNEVLWDIADIEGPPREGEKKRRSVRIDETFNFTCAKCTAGAGCMVCHEGARALHGAKEVEKSAESEGPGDGVHEDEDKKDKTPKAIMFRCFRCKQSLRAPFEDGDKYDLDDVAEHYQKPERGNDQWQCHQCRDWVWGVDIICAWRPFPADAVETDKSEKPNPKVVLPREYLVKWVGRGFRHVTWVPHAWIMVVAMMKLRIFLEKGPSLNLITDETLAAHGDEMDAPTIANLLGDGDTGLGDGRGRSKADWKGYGPAPDVNGVTAIPSEWMTADRVLDVCLMAPPAVKKAPKPQVKGNRVVSLSPSPSVESDIEPHRGYKYTDGLEPPDKDRVPIDDWEISTGRTLTDEDIEEVAGLVSWCYVKWDDLQYDQSCWDTPPPVDSTFYPAFQRALGRYLKARQIDIPVLTDAQIRRRETDAARQRTPPQTQPDCIVGGKLMDFQMQGFQWLLYKYFKRESCILADDMGLGKTIQIASLLGYLGSEGLDIYPVLVIVPNSTITNWVREFEKWVPHMRVVPFYGEKASRKVIKQYELYHKGMQGKAAGLKAHVVLTTYDMITSADFRVFHSVPRWEVVCVDEGQRLKSDSNLIFNNLKKLNSVHRILLTGTPLNNNLRELFNLLNFLDGDTFKQLQDLEDRFANLNEGLIQELHNMIRPYILRRIKADVLKLPPKIEIIVPISLSPIQKNVYKGILERNAEALKAIAAAKMKRSKNKSLKNVSGGGGVIANKEVVSGAANAEAEQAQVLETIEASAELAATVQALGGPGEAGTDGTDGTDKQEGGNTTATTGDGEAVINAGGAVRAIQASQPGKSTPSISVPKEVDRTVGDSTPIQIEPTIDDNIEEDGVESAI